MTQLAELYRVDNFNDTFALGHYARVLDALDRRSGHTVAFKVLRPEHLPDDDKADLSWEYRAFANEATLLMKLTDTPVVIDLLDCGYISSDAEAPVDGEMVSFRRDVVGFVQGQQDYAKKGWRPFLCLQNLPRTYNLYYLMRPGRQKTRWRLPTEEGLSLALQFGEMLKVAHSQNIVYLDHKLEHVYWDGTHLRIIDLNSSRQLDGGPSVSHYTRMDIHNLCVGILYSVFTGLSPKKGTLRPQPGGMEDVEGRYKDVQTLDFDVEPTLSDGIKALLQRGAAMQVLTINDFIEELQAVALLHGWDFPNQNTDYASREARDQMRAGLARLRRGQADLREARDLFREAAIKEGIPEELELELRRMVKHVNAMLNNRVIP